MKATELMIEDWVLWKNKYVKVVGTSAIVYSFGQIDVLLAYCNDDGAGIEKHDISKISPIPLTPEILKENGWWYAVEDMWLHDKVDFGIERWNGGFQCYNINQIKLDSVHQLQHALRLCGLYELADNFKL